MIKSSALTPWGRLTHLYERELVKLFKIFQSQALSTQTLRQITNNPAFRQQADRIARNMATAVHRTNAATWQEAAMRSTKAHTIWQALQRELRETGEKQAIERIIRQNAQQIRSIPLGIAENLTQFISERQQAGIRGKELEHEIRERVPHLTATRIKLIARTEIGKSETALTRARSEEIGVDWYQWATSEDSRVRVSHRNLDEVLIAWNDPPAPERLIGEPSKLGRGHCGEFPNCRCVSLPLISLDVIKWPARVHWNDSIVRMTRAQFIRTAGIKIAA